MNILKRKRKEQIEEERGFQSSQLIPLDNFYIPEVSMYVNTAEVVLPPSGSAGSVYIASEYDWMPPSGTYTDWDDFYYKNSYIREFTCSYCRRKFIMDLKKSIVVLTALQCPSCGATI